MCGLTRGDGLHFSLHKMLTEWIIVMFLSDSHSDGTHSLQSIHWLSFWRHPFTPEHPLLRHISPNLMKKQTHLHLWCPDIFSKVWVSCEETLMLWFRGGIWSGSLMWFTQTVSWIVLSLFAVSLHPYWESLCERKSRMRWEIHRSCSENQSVCVWFLTRCVSLQKEAVFSDCSSHRFQAVIQNGIQHC